MSDDIATDDMIRVGDNNVSFYEFWKVFATICDIVSEHIKPKVET